MTIEESSPSGYFISTERGGVDSIAAVLYFLSLLTGLGGETHSSSSTLLLGVVRQISEGVEGRSSRICFNFFFLAGV